MSVRVSGKHMDVGESFRQKIEDNISQAVTKYFDGGYSGQVTVAKSGQLFASDCKIHLDTGVVLHAAGQANDPQASFDAAAERIEKRLRRYKRRLKDHHNGSSAKGIDEEVAYRVMDAVPDEDEEIAEDFAPTIVAETSKQIKTMTVASAVMALDMTDEPVLLFRSPSKELNIVYRRHDGNIGWIDAAMIKS
ncbi:ribosome-associated translation inhibitor RaiA [uncultured Agrobacterium sp.]|uniref:ribosome hibernation-promoting factor, HPF/YfiA family n=1 Tax=uncultured Agrobacterium sp. TaxID=157277 RepID=UPI0025DC46E7|nr:ribosome-associated translation inhibitor RaiA [uncultured Agrobacterium sp.]